MGCCGLSGLLPRYSRPYPSWAHPQQATWRGGEERRRARGGEREGGSGREEDVTRGRSERGQEGMARDEEVRLEWAITEAHITVPYPGRLFGLPKTGGCRI